MPGSRPAWYLTHEYVGRNQTCDLQKLQVAPLTVPLFLEGRRGGSVTPAPTSRSPPSLDDEFTHNGEVMSLRLIYLHMIEEYARHLGHADLQREQIDGATGE